MLIHGLCITDIVLETAKKKYQIFFVINSLQKFKISVFLVFIKNDHVIIVDKCTMSNLAIFLQYNVICASISALEIKLIQTSYPVYL